MRSPSAPPPPSRSGIRIAVAGLALVLVAGAAGFLLGRRGPEPALGASGPSPITQVAAAPAAAAMPAEAPPPPRRAVQVEGAPAGGPLPVQPPSLPPELVARVGNELAAEIEVQRPLIIRECWNALPPDAEVRAAQGMRRQPEPVDPSRANLLLNVTFDAQGREIARGVSEERGGRAGVAECVSNLAGLGFRVSPPGANVGVTVKVTIP